MSRRPDVRIKALDSLQAYDPQAYNAADRRLDAVRELKEGVAALRLTPCFPLIAELCILVAGAGEHGWVDSRSLVHVTPAGKRLLHHFKQQPKTLVYKVESDSAWDEVNGVLLLHTEYTPEVGRNRPPWGKLTPYERLDLLLLSGLLTRRTVAAVLSQAERLAERVRTYGRSLRA